MNRLRELKNYLIENGGIRSADIVCHTGNGELIPVEQETATGVHLFDEKYDAVIYIEDVSEREYGNIKLLLYDWFRLNKVNDDESLRLSTDETSDVSSLVTIDLVLVETMHLQTDETGTIEKDGEFYSRGDEPIPVGI